MILDGSRLHLTVLDIRPVWATGLPGGPDDTVLQVIAADVTALVPGEDVIAAVVADLKAARERFRAARARAIPAAPTQATPRPASRCASCRERRASCA